MAPAFILKTLNNWASYIFLYLQLLDTNSVSLHVTGLKNKLFFYGFFLASAGLTFLKPKNVGYVRGKRPKRSNIEI